VLPIERLSAIGVNSVAAFEERWRPQRVAICRLSDSDELSVDPAGSVDQAVAFVGSDRPNFQVGGVYFEATSDFVGAGRRACLARRTVETGGNCAAFPPVWLRRRGLSAGAVPTCGGRSASGRKLDALSRIFGPMRDRPSAARVTR
jgi:hypothetical protein